MRVSVSPLVSVMDLAPLAKKPVRISGPLVSSKTAVLCSNVIRRTIG